jgi:hypothetical protein
VGATIPATLQATVEAVRSLTEGAATTTAQQVGKALSLDTSAAWRRLRAAAKDGYVENVEDRPRRPGRWKVGADLPAFAEGLLPPVAIVEQDKPAGQSIVEADDCANARLHGGEQGAAIAADDADPFSGGGTSVALEAGS